MKPLAEVLRRSSVLHDFKAEADWDEIQLGDCYVCCECGEHFEHDDIANAHEAWHEHVIAHQAAVVAEWLESDEVRDFVRIRLTYFDSAVGPALAALAAHAKGEAS